MDDPGQQPPNPLGKVPRPIRWWPLPIILILAMGGIIWARVAIGTQRQDRNLATAVILILTFFLLLIWFFLLSRVRAKLRWQVLGGVIGLIVLLKIFFPIRGVSGDLVPILQWRWSHATWNAPLTQNAIANSSVKQNEFTNDYPQFMGPDRNATLPDLKLARDWTAQPPKQLWQQSVGSGWSGFAVVGNRAITQEQRGDNETIDCYDLITGKPIWTCEYPAHFQSTLAGEGPRATPTIVSNRVYALGSTGILTCADLETGKRVWSKNILEENHARVPDWGISSSPLVTNGLVVVEAGGEKDRSLVAYAADDGHFVWGGGNASAGYSSPFLTTFAGVRQIVIFNEGAVLGHDPVNGSNLWQYPWLGGQPNVSTPVALPGDRLLASSGYGVGSELLHLQTNAHGRIYAERVWKSNRLKAKFTDVIYFDGFFYGLDDGIMTCLDATSGEQKWKEGRYGHGQEILVGKLLLVTAESGEVILLEPNPKEPCELARFSALKGKTWNPPALAGQYLLVRNDKEAACYSLPVMKNDKTADGHR